jgi:hypothetical protein
MSEDIEKDRCQKLFDEQVALAAIWQSNNEQLTAYDALAAAWERAERDFEADWKKEEQLLQDYREKTTCESVPLTCAQRFGTEFTDVEGLVITNILDVSCPWPQAYYNCKLLASGIRGRLARYKLGLTESTVRSKHKCPNPLLSGLKVLGNRPVFADITFGSIQCCKQDFSGLTFGKDNAATIADITQQCQLSITNLSNNDPTDDPTDDPAKTISTEAVIGIVLVAVALIAWLVYSQWKVIVKFFSGP